VQIRYHGNNNWKVEHNFQVPYALTDWTGRNSARPHASSKQASTSPVAREVGGGRQVTSMVFYSLNFPAYWKVISALLVERGNIVAHTGQTTKR
jgi:hypothetical protein